MKASGVKASIDELRLAWHRVKLDRPDRCFVDHPYLTKWIESDLDSWLVGIQEELAEGYAPRDCQPCPAPKEESLIRPGAVLDIRDETVYNLLVGRFFPGICGLLGKLQGDPDVAYQLPESPETKEWLKVGFLIWKEWRERSLAKLKEGASYVVVSDITGFYDNIDIRRLISDLRGLEDREPDLRLLAECLNRWSFPREKGIPQGYSASDMLAKLYLHSVDVALRNKGVVHLRYVDDYRIFLNSKRSARQAILHLSRLMHCRGLNLQSAKTEILPRDDAVGEFDGIAPLIENVQQQLARELIEDADMAGEYLPSWEIMQVLERREGPAPELLQRTFSEHFSTSGDTQFNKTLFHYLLTRLGITGSVTAADYCIDVLRTHPEESAPVLRYLSTVKMEPAQIHAITRYMGSEEAIYDYQLYQLVRWFYDTKRGMEDVSALCRIWVHDQNRAQWLRSYCSAYLGEYGDKSDLERLESSYAGLGSELDRADAVAALRRQERSRRNAFYGRAKCDGEIVARAVNLVKSTDSVDAVGKQ